MNHSYREKVIKAVTKPLFDERFVWRRKYVSVKVEYELLPEKDFISLGLKSKLLPGIVTE